VQDSRRAARLFLPCLSWFRTFHTQGPHVTTQRETGRTSADERKARCNLTLFLVPPAKAESKKRRARANKPDRGIFEKVPGSGVWWIRYVDAEGRYRREKVGTWGNADKLLTKRKNQALQGKKLPETLRRAPVTFREIATETLAWSDAHKRSKRMDHSRMKKLLNWFGDSSIESITPQEIERRFQGEFRTSATWNRYRALLHLLTVWPAATARQKTTRPGSFRTRPSTMSAPVSWPLRRKRSSAL
jgi:hypothetical protein